MDKNIAQTSKKIIVIYHDDLDGFTGAWAAWKKLKDKAQYIPASYSRDSENNFFQFTDKEIYLIDYSFDSAKIKSLAEKNKVILIDHHLSSKEIANYLPGSLHDLNRSGATLSWQYFHSDKKIPRFVLHIEDMDIWKFKLPFTKEITAALELYDFDFKMWDKMAKIFENKNNKKALEIIKEGKTILKYQDALINKLIERGREVIFEGYESFAVNSPVLISEIGHKIYENTGKLGIIWWYKGKNDKRKIKISLRTDGKINASKLAEKYGGGGQLAAAGFMIEGDMNFPWQLK